MSVEPIVILRKNSRENLYVGIDRFRGNDLFHARVHFEADDGTWQPGKVGLAFNIELLLQFRDAIDQTIAEARRRGLSVDSSGDKAHCLSRVDEPSRHLKRDPETTDAQTTADPMVIQAAAWVATGGIDRSRAAVPQLREKFGLSAPQACHALREAALIRARAH
jgi:Transcriptional Coactivator p15 (PC4)